MIETTRPNPVPALALALLAGALLAAWTARAAVPIRWTVETSRAQVAQFDAFRGETLDLVATMQSYGSPLATPVQPSLYWQTNGMGAAWWTAPATASGNVLRATWTPTNDCGGTVYNCFIGGPDATYRAAFRLRMLPSPGASPNTIDLPVQRLDFATVEVKNAPWATAGEVAGMVAEGTRGLQPLLPYATNAIPQGVVSGGPFLPLAGGKVTGTVNFGGDNRTEASFTTIVPSTLLDGAELTVGSAAAVTDGGSIVVKSGARAGGTLVVESPFDPENATASASIKKGTKEVATEEQVAAVSNNVASLGTTVDAWQTYWDGDDVRVTVTNYFGAFDIPSLYFEQKMPADSSHPEAWFKTVWDERTRWDRFLEGYATVTNHIERDLADRAWGVYDSATGDYSPDGILQVSQSEILLGGGLSWQQLVTAKGYWVLTANGSFNYSATTNDALALFDAQGNKVYEIVKGDKRLVGATATNITVSADGGTIVIHYPVEASEHPTVEWTTALSSNSTWATLDATTTPKATWSGSSGAYVVTISNIPASNKSGFFRATYEAGGDTYIKNNVAISVDKVVIGGVTYTVHVETVNGKNMMVLQ